MKYFKILLQTTWSIIFLLSPAYAAEESLCAVVKIEISQELTLERQAFDAHMRINNGLSTLSLENVEINVTFADEDGEPVLATSESTDTTASFFIRTDSLDGIDDINGNGSIAPISNAEIHWLIIPAPGTGGAIPAGTLYYVGATLKYTLGGEEHTTQVTPDYIFVKPQPLLTLDYFLPYEVHADDAFTPEIEPPEPFNLGVRVKNDGFGPAHDLQIDSAQPRIVENQQGLLIGFEIIGSSVNDQPVNPSLLVDFGAIEAGQSSVGRWQMLTTLSGQFTQFQADFSHADELGGELTSLLQAVNTHRLIKDVLVDLPGRDEIRDFLAKEGDIIHIYESHGLDTQVNDHSANTTLQLAAQTDSQITYDINAPATAGFLYLKLPAPSQANQAVNHAQRADGKILPPDNAWLSKTRRGADNGWDYFLNLFDNNSPGHYQITLATTADDPQPPVLQFIPDRATGETQRISFLVEASASNGTKPTLAATPLPNGAAITALNEGKAIFDWTPLKGQAGDYPITFTASDGQLEISQTAHITVYSLSQDSDGDGVLDSCEIQYFGNLDRDGRDDFDQDGQSDLIECLQGTDPTFKIPTIVINEIDAQVADNQLTEFIELYDGGTGNTPLDNLVIVLFNGQTDQAYQVFDLTGFTTQADGYFIIAGSDLSQADFTVSETNWLVDDAAAVALYVGKATDFPTGTDITTTQLLDALVYDTDDADDPGLLALLEPEQPQIDEAGSGHATSHSNGRCDNGTGGSRQTHHYRQVAPSPAAPNHCQADLSIILADSADPVNAGADFNYILTLNNAGPHIASTVQVVSTLPEGTSFINAEGIDWTCNLQPENTLTCQLATLAVDETTTLTINLTAPPTASEITNQATFTTGTVDPNENNNTITEITLVEISGPSAPVLATQTVTGDWQSVDLSTAYQTPVIIAGPASSNDLEPGVVRLRNVTSTGFELRFQEWTYLDDQHAQETLPYLVMEAGRYSMDDGSQWEVGHFNVGSKWKDIQFGQSFPGQPHLFLTPQTEQDTQTITVRAKDITAQGFAAALYEEEGKGYHPTEIMGYLAIYTATDTGTITLGGQSIDYQLQQIQLDSSTSQAGLRLEEEYSLDDETHHIAETIDILTLGEQTFAQIISLNETDTVTLREGFSPPSEDQQLGEQGIKAATHDWQAISLANTYQNPVVITAPASSNDLQPGVVRLRNVTATGFELRFQEWTYLDDQHAQETLPYLVIEAGRYPMNDGSQWEVGHINLTHQWKNIHFGLSFPGQPHLFLTPQTEQNAQTITVRAKDITAHGFAAALYEQESYNHHPSEIVGYLAIYHPNNAGTITLGGQAIDYQMQQIQLDSSTSQAGLRLEEEYSLDNETHHIAETIDILTLGEQTFAQIISLNETDTVTLREGFSLPSEDQQLGEQNVGAATHDWQVINLGNTYQNPVVITGPATSNDLQPGVVRLRHVTSTGFELRFQEWDYLDDQHAQETLPYLVIEAGRYPMNDGSQWEIGHFNVSSKWKNIHFGLSFPGQPHLFLTPQTQQDAQTITVRAKDLTAHGFAAALYEEESKSYHPAEIVGYLAIYHPNDAGTITLAGQTINYQMQQIQLDSPTTQTGLRLEEEYSEDDETYHVAETIDLLTLGEQTFAQIISFNEADTVTVRQGISPPTDDQQLGESGIKATTHDWQAVNFGNTYQNPVVIVGPASSNDLEPGIVRLTNVTPTNFELRFQEWTYLDDQHAQETLPYLVIEAGHYLMNDSSQWEAGHFNLGSTGKWKNIHFGLSFPNQPYLFLTLQTYQGKQTAIVRVQDITPHGFAAALYEQESQKYHPTEIVGYLAIYNATGNGTLTLSGQSFAYQLQQIQLDNLTTQAGLWLAEEQSLDDETDHALETIALLTLGDQTFAQITSFNETDPVTLRYTQQTRQGQRSTHTQKEAHTQEEDAFNTSLVTKPTKLFENHGLEVNLAGQQNHSLTYFIGTLTDSTFELQLYPAPSHVGQSADLFLWVVQQQNQNPTHYYWNQQTQWQRWNGQLPQLPATSTYNALPIRVQETFNLKPLTGGEIKLYIGYRLTNGTIVYYEF